MDDYVIEYKWMIIGDLVNHSSGKPKNKIAILERFLFQIKFRIVFLGAYHIIPLLVTAKRYRKGGS